MSDASVTRDAGSSSADAALVAQLGNRSIVLIGMMGAGKTTVGWRLAARLGIPFVDADAEIELAANMSIPDIFATKGEPYFRNGEARVIARLLEQGPQVLATGGGAYMNPDTRALIRAKGISVWLKAELDVLLKRIKRRGDRPLLKDVHPKETLARLIGERYPVYAEADVTVLSRDVTHDSIVDEIATALRSFGRARSGDPKMTAPLRAGDPVTVKVALGERTYDIVIGRGLLPSLGSRIAALKPGAKAAIVVDEAVAKLHLPAAGAALAAANIPAVNIVVPQGEGSKSFSMFEQVCEQLIDARIERGDLVVALGGGVVGDLTGFAAAVVRRGLDFVQVPTSLLAQVDSSVGGKTAINSSRGKNLVGAFHQPILVLADTALLDTLPPREFRAGYAEVAKYGLLGDAGFFAWLDANAADVFAGNGNAREHAIATCCRMKADIVARDERETGDRALLNLGHTFGHAFEAAAGFSGRLLHGEAVALGCALAFEFSTRLGLMPGNDAERVAQHLAAVGLPTRIKDLQGPVPDVDRLMALIAQDKKVRRGALTFILVRGVGKAFVTHDVDADQVRNFLAEILSEQ